MGLILDHSGENLAHSGKFRVLLLPFANWKEDDQTRIQCQFSMFAVRFCLSWNNHLTELPKTLARTACIFYKIRSYAPKDTLILLYHIVFAPFLSYGVSVWGLAHPSLLDAVSILQKKNFGIIVFSGNTAPSAPIFESLQILKFNDIITYQITSFALK